MERNDIGNDAARIREEYAEESFAIRKLIRQARNEAQQKILEARQNVKRLAPGVDSNSVDNSSFGEADFDSEIDAYASEAESVRRQYIEMVETARAESVAKFESAQARIAAAASGRAS